MNRFLGVFAAGVTVNTAILSAQTEQPNVLMVIVDDWGYHDLSLTGSKLYETHNIDRLADESTIFSQAYVAYPRSVPSRYSIMTGRHCARMQTGAKNDDRKVDTDSYCIAEPFKAGGYETFFIGKWHLSDGKTLPQHKGFDINIGGGKAGGTGTHFAPFNKPSDTNPDKLIYGMDDANPGEYLTDYMSRKTVDYIRQKHDKPFFAVCSFYAVHTPIEGKKELIGKYRKKVKSLNLSEDILKKEEAGVTKTQQDHPVYAAMIESVDNAVGDMIAALKETGQYDNTVFILISDHGGLSNRGMKPRELATTNSPLKAGKGHLYEGGIRVPLLIHTPGQHNKQIKDQMVMSYDLLPTLADICNLKVSKEAELDGISIKPLLDGKKQEQLDSRDLFWHKASERPNSTGDYVSTAIRSGNYKLIDFYLQNRVELYDLSKDPGEKNNIAAQNPEKVTELMAKIETWRKNTGVKMGEKGNAEHKKKKKAGKIGNKIAEK